MENGDERIHVIRCINCEFAKKTDQSIPYPGYNPLPVYRCEITNDNHGPFFYCAWAKRRKEQK